MASQSMYDAYEVSSKEIALLHAKLNLIFFILVLRILSILT